MSQINPSKSLKQLHFEQKLLINISQSTSCLLIGWLMQCLCIPSLLQVAITLWSLLITTHKERWKILNTAGFCTFNCLYPLWLRYRFTQVWVSLFSFRPDMSLFDPQSPVGGLHFEAVSAQHQSFSGTCCSAEHRIKKI